MLGVVAIPAAIMFVGVLFLPESPRWLFLKGLKDRAVAVFERMHLDEAEIAAEVKEIEDNLKVKQNGFVMFKTNPNFRRVIGLNSDECTHVGGSRRAVLPAPGHRQVECRWLRLLPSL
jgi:SP family galactose:H+ symporter-like MFS transporter